MNHVRNLEQEMLWLEACLRRRINIEQGKEQDESFPQPPHLESQDSAYGDFVNKNDLNEGERMVLAVALAPHLPPHSLNVFFQNKPLQLQSKIARGEAGLSFVPTAETALWILTGKNLKERVKYTSIFKTSHIFYKQSVIEIGETHKNESIYDGVLSLSPSYRDLFVENQYSEPRFSADFPAHLLTTKLEWDDLMLMPATQARLDEVKAYLHHYDTLVNKWAMQKHSKPGCRILFYGDSGTGKTLAATLLGKLLKRQVFRVDISAVTSKYVGETTKRLESLFNTAESKGWIIFIDEGDALLGQRKSMDTNSNNSHYANQDTAFLLQRIETFDGIVVVATNFKNNIDQAFTRRFQAMVRFQLPDSDLQYKLWQENLPKECPLSSSIDLKALIQRHPLSPAAIINVIFRVCILTLQKGITTISQEDLLMCIKDEELKYIGRQAMGM
jgi:DNA replication protein DnaC